MLKETDEARLQKRNYEQERRWCQQFLEEFSDPSYDHPQFGQRKYLVELQRTLDRQNRLFEVHLEDLDDFFSGEQYRDFLSSIRRNTARYLKLFTQAADQLRVEPSLPPSPKEELEAELLNFQLAHAERRSVTETNPAQPQQAPGEARVVDSLRRKFTLAIVPGPNAKIRETRLRELRGELIGSLVTVRAMVVRASEVKPRIEVAAYDCEVCREDIYKTVNSEAFLPPVICNSESCRKNNARGSLVANYALSKFCAYQELKVQETSDQTPPGAIPRSFTVVLRGAAVQQCAPGDTVKLTGVFLPRAHDGLRNLRDQLLHETYIEGLKVVRERRTEDGFSVNSDLKKQLVEISRQDDLLSRLSRSLAPEIFGMELVKRTLLCQLVGGSTVSFADGLKIRGDINVALIGDPGVAKSQLLKHIAHLSPRGVYTTGKGSSGAGLTASVTRDQNTGEITLDGGALVLSDLGICCIDEFDKMADGDKVSIHEVMEQQTISLAKAGVTTSLNARVAVLAAANPIWGRYNRSKTPHENIGLSHSLLSRFDLVFILLDRAQRELDRRLAEHVTFVHQHGVHPRERVDFLDPALLKAYIALAKSFNPTLGPELHEYMTNQYVEKRRLNRELGKGGQYVTPRSLLAAVRFAQALAKLRFSERVERGDVDEALALLEAAQASVHDEQEEADVGLRRKALGSASTQLYRALKDIARAEGLKDVPYKLAEKKLISKGFSLADLPRELADLEADNLILLLDNNAKIRLM